MLKRVDHRYEVEALLDLFNPSSVKFFKIIQRGELACVFVVKFRTGELPIRKGFPKRGKERPIAAADIQDMAKFW